jgi:putative ubiquitin-RnfH superfamily antitoxin RatB of RatAB toxin-antitoxin module
VKVQVVRAWPDRYDSIRLVLAPGATVQDAVRASGLALDGVAGWGVFGERAAPERLLADGDRVELLGPLLVDPKDARRKRAQRKD